MKINPNVNTTKNSLNKTNINFSKILKDSCLFKDPTLIKKALKKGTISTKNYNLKKLKKKLNFQNSNELEGEREIPYELLTILEKRQKKYKRINNLYKSIKKENDTFLSYWHYTKKIKEKAEKRKMLNEELEKNEENNDYKTMKKIYDFSNKDKIEMDLQKKFATKIFKSNPLIINENSEMYFYFLNEAYNSPNKSVNFKDQSSSKYLVKVKDYLEYKEILSDKSLDDYNKRIKLMNCSFTKNQDKKIKEEKKKILLEQHKNDINEMSESKIMIKKTNSLLKQLERNKDYLENPSYFTLYRKNDIKCFTPSRRLENKSMDKSSRSDFFINNKSHIVNKDKYDTMRILKLKKIDLSKQLNSLMSDSTKRKSKRIKKLRINNISPIYDKNNNESYSKDNNSTLNINFYNSMISSKQNNNSNTNSIFFRKNNKKFLPSIKKYFPFYGFTNSSNSNSIIIQQKIPEEKKIKENENIDITTKVNNNINNSNIELYNKITNVHDEINNKDVNNNIRLNIEYNINSEIKNDLSNNRENNKIHKNINNYIDKTDTEINIPKNIDNNVKDVTNNNNIIIDIQNKKSNIINNKEKIKDKKIIISDLYEGIKYFKKLNDSELKDIDTYINQKGIEYKRNKDTINLIKEAQITIEQLDINKIAKQYIEAKNKGYNKIKNIKKMNKKLKKLDRKYIQDICEFNIKYGKKDYKFN